MISKFSWWVCRFRFFLFLLFFLVSVQFIVVNVFLRLDDAAMSMSPREVSLSLLSPSGDVLIASTGSPTYLCTYMKNATVVRNGCMELCRVRRRSPVDGVERVEEFFCRVLSSTVRGGISEADVAINHGGPLPVKFSNGRPFVTLFYSGESNYTEKGRSKESYQRLYDEVITFHHHRRYYFTWTHRHLPYFTKILNENNNPNGMHEVDEWLAWRDRKSAVAAFFSNCGANRPELIRHLSKYYPIHSFGKCAQTHSIPSSCKGKRYDEKMCVFRMYKYAFALENSDERDYVTEKVYHALLSGAIPLYWGAPNIVDFIPSGKSSIIEMDRFVPGQVGDRAKKVVVNISGFRSLGEYLRELETDRESVQRFFAWRRAKYVEEWGVNFADNLFHPDPLCEVCADAREKRSRVVGNVS